MFVDAEVKELFDKFDEEKILSDNKLRYINNKIKKHGYIAINITELNYLYHLNNINIKYDMYLLKDLLHKSNIGYTSIIKQLKIPRATLSKILNKDRNIKLVQYNNFCSKLNTTYNLNLDKNTIKIGV
jgi:DNA-binding Xre family transcriptional regulator